jgi:hypothetical protein
MIRNVETGQYRKSGWGWEVNATLRFLILARPCSSWSHVKVEGLSNIYNVNAKLYYF